MNMPAIEQSSSNMLVHRHKPTFADIQDEIANMLTIPDEELDEEQKQLMDAYLNELGSQEAEKIDKFAQFVRLQSDFVSVCKNEAERLKARAKTAENRIAFLKKIYLDQMMQHNLKKISGDVYTLSLRKSEAVSTPTLLDGLDDIYLRRKEIVEPDKQVIKEALKAGIEVPGCQLVENYSLQIR